MSSLPSASFAYVHHYVMLVDRMYLNVCSLTFKKLYLSYPYHVCYCCVRSLNLIEKQWHHQSKISNTIHQKCEVFLWTVKVGITVMHH